MFHIYGDILRSVFDTSIKDGYYTDGGKKEIIFIEGLTALHIAVEEAALGT